MLPELLAPAGNMTKLQIALQYGADAVYLGGRSASLRSNAEFSIEELALAVEYCHSNNKKVYITANIIPHNRDLAGLKEYLQEVAKASPDGVIISDLGTLDLCQKYAPNVPIHISTQANNTNYQAGIKWHELGAKRIILARELTLDEIKEYRENAPDSLELEVFVHGAMCMGYSGRCLISNYLTHRNANQGACAQPCRWEWSIEPSAHPSVGDDALIVPAAQSPHHEATEDNVGANRIRPAAQPPCIKTPPAIVGDDALIVPTALTNGTQSIHLHENPAGTFFLNSKDMCLIRHLRRLQEIGITSLKIEGRNKSEYYTAAVTKTYRTELDNMANNLPFDESLLDELEKVSHREYVYNFGQLEQIYGSSSYIRSMEVMGIVADKCHCEEHLPAVIARSAATKQSSDFHLLPCFQRGKIVSGDALEILTPAGPNIKIEHAEIFDPLTLEPIDSTPHSEMPFYLKSPLPVPPNSFIRK